ncbi:MAG: diacylglycerol kinase [Patescibacteria group bacterium]
MNINKDLRQESLVVPKKVVKYNLFKSPYYAAIGIITAFKREPNLHLQVVIGILFALIAIVNQRWITGMANIILMSVVISLEMLNSAIETICDLVQPQYNAKVKIIKDMAAGSVLIVALSWLVVLVYQILVIFVFKIPPSGTLTLG